MSEPTPNMSDKANLLDTAGYDRVGRFAHYIVVESAVVR